MSNDNLWISKNVMLKGFFSKLCPRDIIAVFIICNGFFLLYKGIDTIVGGAVIAVVTYYFVRRNEYDNPKTN